MLNDYKKKTIVNHLQKISRASNDIKQTRAAYIDAINAQDYKDTKKIINLLERINAIVTESDDYTMALESTERIITNLSNRISEKYTCDQI